MASSIIAGTAVVAVLDTGVDTSHPDLAGKTTAASTDPNGHGTAMAGIIAAGVDNGTGIAGVAYDGVSVMPVTVMGADGTGYDSDIIDGHRVRGRQRRRRHPHGLQQPGAVICPRGCGQRRPRQRA